jgi:ribosome-binding protein aMBF1 (putative translation factor)
MNKSELQPILTDAIKATIEQSGLGVYRIANAAGISPEGLGRFFRGEKSMQLTIADKLTACFGLRLVRTGDAKPLGPTLTKAIKAAIKRSGLSRYRIAKEAGIHEDNLRGFVSGSRSARLKTADKLAAFLGLRLMQGPGAVGLRLQGAPGREAAPPQPILTDAIKAAIERSGLPRGRIAKETGIDKSNLRRFLRGVKSFRLDTADKLAAFLGLRLVRTGDAKPLGPTLTKAIKAAIKRSGLSYCRINKATRIENKGLGQVPRREVSMQLTIADRLATYLGLQLVPAPGAKPPEPTPANLARPTLAKRKAKRKAN